MFHYYPFKRNFNIKYAIFYRVSVEVNDVCGSPFKATLKGLAINLSGSSLAGAATNVYHCKDERGVSNQLGCYRGFFLVIQKVPFSV